MQCLALVLTLLILIALGPAIGAALVAILNLCVAWAFVTAGLLVPTWLTSPLIVKYTEEYSDERTILSYAHSFVYGLAGVTVGTLFVPTQVKGTIWDLFFWLPFFGSSAYVATAAWLVFRPAFGKKAQTALSVLAVFLIVVAFWIGVFYAISSSGILRPS